VFDYAGRRQQLDERLREEEIAALFLPLSSDLEYLTGLERPLPSYGQVSQAHDWISGGFLRPGHDPVFLLSRMESLFDVADVPGELVIVNESDDALAAFARVAGGSTPERIAVGDRTRAETVLALQGLDSREVITATHLVNELRRVKSPEELAVMERACRIAEDAMVAVTPRVQPGVTMLELLEEVEHQLREHGARGPSFPTHIFTGIGEADLDSGGLRAREPLAEDRPVLFDFGAALDGYCSDFGRTIWCGEPRAEDRELYALMLAAQEAGRAAAKPGVLARDVNAACRAPIEDAGLGAHFRHRMGHGIGLDVHERPFLSEEDETPLQAGMTFTDEPSLVPPEGNGCRIEDVIVCEDGGARKLNGYPPSLVST
jgi:Xaa-Pro aminopeptidase